MNRRPTQDDVAQKAGVSRGLVSLALSGAPGVNKTTRERILAAAESLGYVRNIGAAALAGKFHSTLGFVMPDLRNPFFDVLVSELQVGADFLNLLPVIVTSLNDADHEVEVIRKLHEMNVAGIVVVSPVETPEQLIRAASALPLVVIGAEPTGGNIDVVAMDENAAAALVATHIRERGWQRALHLSTPLKGGDIWVRRRQNALAHALNGIPFEQATIEPSTSLVRTIEEFEPKRENEPLAIIVHNDQLAMDVIPAVHSMGLTPGRDVAVVSYDDTHVARHPEWSLTSVSQDASTLVSTALERIRYRGDHLDLPGCEFLVEPALSVRTTS
ncbi:LacI family DNA-binding transcriptional regulator [Actinomycetaceae bacterium L2_0104]